jgi:ribonucleoside-diphosphate reductase alpha chain
MTSPREKLPNRRRGISFTAGSGQLSVHVSTGEYEDGSLGEIFLDSSKEGTFSRDVLNAFAVTVSLGLQHGVPLSAFTHAFRDFRMEPDILREIFSAIEDRYKHVV